MCHGWFYIRMDLPLLPKSKWWNLDETRVQTYDVRANDDFYVCHVFDRIAKVKPCTAENIRFLSILKMAISFGKFMCLVEWFERMESSIIFFSCFFGFCNLKSWGDKPCVNFQPNWCCYTMCGNMCISFDKKTNLMLRERKNRED